MKVLQVIDQLKQGGTERVAVDLAILLSKTKDVEVSFYCLLDSSHLDKELIDSKIDVTYLKRKNKFNPIKLLKLWNDFNNYEIIHIHSRQVLRYVGLLFLIPFKKSFKVIFHDHYGAIESDQEYSKYLKFCIQNSLCLYRCK